MGEREVEHKTRIASLGLEFKLRAECEEKVEGAQREAGKLKGNIQYSRNTKKSYIYNTKDHETTVRDKIVNEASRD